MLSKADLCVQLCADRLTRVYNCVQAGVDGEGVPWRGALRQRETKEALLRLEAATLAFLQIVVGLVIPYIVSCQSSVIYLFSHLFQIIYPKNGNRQFRRTKVGQNFVQIG